MSTKLTKVYMGDISENFDRKEFDCPCQEACVAPVDISTELVETLQIARTQLGDELFINSGIRCSRHNEAVGGKSTSSHLKGVAVDIRCREGHTRIAMLKVLVPLFKRIGVGKTFIHVDVDTSKADSCWVY